MSAIVEYIFFSINRSTRPRVSLEVVVVECYPVTIIEKMLCRKSAWRAVSRLFFLNPSGSLEE